MAYKLGKTLAAISMIGYLIAMVLEAWRPGFVVFFWNPQWLILAAIIGIIFALVNKPVEQKSCPQYPTQGPSKSFSKEPPMSCGARRTKNHHSVGYCPLAFRLLLAIIGAFAVWQVFPRSGTGWVVSIGVFLLILNTYGKLSFLQNHKK